MDLSYETETKGQESVAHVRVENPTDKLAFFVHVAMTKGRDGKEVLPVFWEDNYFPMMPGETKTIRAEYCLKDLGEAIPALEIDGWNVRKK